MTESSVCGLREGSRKTGVSKYLLSNFSSSTHLVWSVRCVLRRDSSILVSLSRFHTGLRKFIRILRLLSELTFDNNHYDHT